MLRYAFLVAALLGLLHTLAPAQSSYTPQSKQQMVEMLAARCDTDEARIWEILRAAEEVHRQFKVPVSVTLAIMLVESGGMQSDLCRLANNCMGLTESFDYHNGPVYCKQHETIDRDTGKSSMVTVCFRAYADIESCLMDFGLFVANERRWWYADAYRCPSFDAACWIDAMAGSHDEPGYAARWKEWREACLNVAEVYNLKLADR